MCDLGDPTLKRYKHFAPTELAVMRLRDSINISLLRRWKFRTTSHLPTNRITETPNQYSASPS